MFEEPRVRQEYKDYLAGKARTKSLPRDTKRNVAVYGIRGLKGKGQGEALYGPVDWEQFFPTWDTVGKEFEEESWKTRHGWNPMIGKHMKFLKDRGFIFEKKLGEGAFGQVWKVRATKLRERTDAKGKVKYVSLEVACKLVELKAFKSYSLKGAVDELKRESDIHETLRHTNIVNVEKVIHVEDKKSGFPQPIKVCIFMELCDGDLSSIIQSTPSGFLSEKDTQQWFRDIVFGLRYIHDLDLAHFDIKPHNILYKVEYGSKVFKLADFGLSYAIPPGQAILGRLGTPGYMAPEMGQAAGAQPKPCDIYSLGVTLAESLVGNDRNKLVGILRRGPLTQPHFLALSQHYSISEQVFPLIEGMVLGVAQRLTIEGVIQNDWFTAVFP